MSTWRDMIEESASHVKLLLLNASLFDGFRWMMRVLLHCDEDGTRTARKGREGKERDGPARLEAHF